MDPELARKLVARNFTSEIDDIEKQCDQIQTHWRHAFRVGGLQDIMPRHEAWMLFVETKTIQRSLHSFKDIVVQLEAEIRRALHDAVATDENVFWMYQRASIRRRQLKNTLASYEPSLRAYQEAYSARALAMCMATHPRLGNTSPLSLLDHDLLHVVATWL